MSRRTILAGVAGISLLALVPAGSAGAGETPAMEISARTIDRFEIGSEETRFGPLEFLGGLELTSPSRIFGSMSAIRFSDAGASFMGVADTGFWFSGGIVRGDDFTPVGVERFSMAPILDGDGMPTGDKRRTDAEGLSVENGIATASFERAHRISEYRIGTQAKPALAGSLDFLVPAEELRHNRGFETVAHAPAGGPLAGARVAIAEMSLDAAGNVFAAILEGPAKGIFTVARTGYDITDGAFLPDGDLLLLERTFSMAQGVAMRLRRIEGDTIGAGKIADGPVLFEADMGYQIDNMEGLDVWRREDGALILSLVSDDNQSLLQRNLYLEFRLHHD